MPFKVQPVANKGNCLFAEKSFVTDEILGYLEGDEVPTDSMYTLRLDAKIIEPTCVLRFMAHSCDPNAYFKHKSRQLFARRAIEVGDEITIDYLFTEPVITYPFACQCGASNCRGEIARSLAEHATGLRGPVT